MRFEALHITKRFGGLLAVDDVSLVLSDETILGVIGPNGAGKSTLFNCMSGFEPFDKGTVILNQNSLPSGEVRPYLDAGIVRTFQNTALFDGMTVRENLEVSARSDEGGAFLKAIFKPYAAAHTVKSLELVDELLKKYDLLAVADKRCETLGSGQRRIVEVVRACAHKPHVLFLDEPAAGLNPTETNELMAIIRKIKFAGTSVIVVEHDLKLIMELCDNVIVLDRGRKIAEGPPHIVQKDPAVIASYLGTKTQHESEK